jgi:hypothetical protein
MADYHLFLSYSRADNQNGWITAFKAELKRRHREYSVRELEIFFDELSIEEGVDWRRRLGEGLRQSRLFLAFLSPNYITAPNCLWEWNEYLLREHSAARGDDGVTPVFFVTPDDLRAAEDQALAEWLTGMEEKYPWFRVPKDRITLEAERLAQPFAQDIARRNSTTRLELQRGLRRGRRFCVNWMLGRGPWRRGTPLAIPRRICAPWPSDWPVWTSTLPAASTASPSPVLPRAIWPAATSTLSAATANCGSCMTSCSGAARKAAGAAWAGEA